MVVSKNDRKLLAHYAKNVGEPGEEYEISDEDLMKLLGLCKVDDLRDIKRHLHELKLIVCSNLDKKVADLTVRGQRVTKESEHPVIRMTEEGYRLGCKYGTWRGRFELWCRENIWFWVVLGAAISAIGILVTIVVAIITN